MKGGGRANKSLFHLVPRLHLFKVRNSGAIQQRTDLENVQPGWMELAKNILVTEVQCGPLVRSAFCPKKIDLSSGLILHPGLQPSIAGHDGDPSKIDLTSRKPLHPWTLQAGCPVS